MARDGSLLEEKGEGDASYNAMDGVHDEDVKRREFSRTSRSSRVWMGDSMRFSMLGRDYAANLYNFAWAQAVQNKPLVSFVAEEATSMGSGSSNSGGDGATNVSGKNDGSSMENMEEANGDLEKEEGELEEGEIVLASADADSVAQQLVPSENDPVPPTVATSEGDNPSGIVEPEAEIDFDSLVVTTLEELEAINEEYAEKCFEEACSRLGKTLEGLQKMVAGSTLPVLDALLQQALMGVRTVYSVYTKRNDQGGEAAIFRLLSHMKKQVSAMLTPEQMKEVNEMMESVAHMAPLSLSVEGTPLLSKIRADYHPLLDLHANHDEDSLPSPTREGIPALPDRKSVSQSMVPKKDRSSRGGEKDGMAFSTYQQKYLRTSFLPPDELPSPTPSEEGNVGDGDLQEVSSSSVLIPSILSEDKPKRQGLIPGVNLAGRAPLKSRDPRLKLTVPAGNAVGANPRKHSFVDESLLEKHTVKRQRHDLPDRTDFLVSMRKEGRIEDNSVRTGQQGIVAQVIGKEEANPAGGKGLPLKEAPLRNDQVPNVSSSPLVSLLSLLKGVAGDPSIVTHLIKEQQRLAVQAQLKTSPMEKTLEAVPSTSGPPPSFPVSDLKIDGKIKAASQTDPQDGAGKIRMKSRDPRRILHNNMLQKSDHDQLKPGAGPTNLDQNKPLGRAQAEHAQLTLSPQSTLIPSAPKQFNKGAKSLADTSPASQAIGVDFSASQTASQLLPTSSETVIVWPVADGSNDQQKTSTSKPSDWWGNMDHLLDGYDERQKAAIQLERARRIEEQNKMIADRKLCLVLDLDHTLLNSAKFSEVDPVHGEILWRKEEQDREKLQRSLFRFPHMGMWTKLRPGIWNFLEKTSKLFELHLYTMGNKLYATEMAKVLDPSGVLFAGRVISKGDDGDLFDGDERLPKSKDLDGVLGMESAVVIIDDSVKVWPHHKLNLIVVERYTYFPCSRRQFGMPGPSLLEIDHDERLEDGTLASALAVIEKIHQTFFAAKCPGDMDVRNIIATEQRRILAGCRIVFSRIFRVGEANPHLHPLWQTAEQFGATCTNQIDDQVTHVVAYSLGTDKVNWALSTGRFVVHPGWVEASALLYRRASEADFAIKPPLAQPP